MTTTLLGIVGVGVIGSIASILISSGADRQWSQGETVMRSFAAAVEHAAYVDCTASANPYASSISFAPPKYADGAPSFRATVTNVGSWNGVGPTVVTTAPQSQPTDMTFRACPVAGSDTGLQRLQLEVVRLDRSGGPDPRGVLTSTVYKRGDS